MRTLAAILVETGKPVVLDEIEVPTLRAGQALVEMETSGVCHTQILEVRGYRGKDPYLPHLLGHEGVGRVVEVAPGTTKVKAGDRVLLSWMRGAGAQVPGTVYGWNRGGETLKVNAGLVTTFSRLTVASESRLMVLPKSIRAAEGALLGCAFPTAMGSLVNTLKVQGGQSIAVIGVGGIGLCAVLGARALGCAPVVAIDKSAEKLELAKKLGADFTFSSTDPELEAKLKAILPGGFDFALEAAGRPETMALAMKLVRQQGGAAVVVGNAREGEKFEIDPKQFNMGKRLFGTWGGDNDVDRDFPRYFRLLENSRIDLSPLVTRTYPLMEANRALDDLESGKAVRPIIVCA